MIADPITSPLSSLFPPRYPQNPTALPGEAHGEGRYRVRFAQDEAELDAVLRLRFQVFNLELGEGLAESFASGRDEDEHDPFCHHLIVEERASGEIVGTYRVRTAGMGCGFYSASEVDLGTLPPKILSQGVEVGRACVARAHRKGQTFLLLWRGLASYLMHNHKRYLFGCCSLPSQRPEDGWRAHAQLAARGAVHPELRVSPLPAYVCPAAPGLENGEVELPALLEIYLRYGGKVLSPPILDRRFKTIDFFVLLDATALDSRSRRMLFREVEV